MREVLERSYDEAPYPDFAFWFTHPDHLGALGTLFGLACPPIAHARVLEIGCASGGNLLSIAASLPGSTCVGVDISGVQIEAAKKHAAAAGITNARFEHADFRDVGGEFDFVICHGVYSWVDEATGQALLQSIRDRLAPMGVAYISYNTYPGWHMVDMVRRLMRLHTADAPSEAARIDQSMQITRWLHRRARMTHGDWRVRFLESELEALKGAGDSLITHDYNAPFNRPSYFVDFLDAAGLAGLVYVANASPWDMYLANYDDDLIEMLSQVPDLVLQQQYLDFVYHTRFRRTLLCRSDAPVTRDVRAELTQRFYPSSSMLEDPGLDGVEIGMPVAVRIPSRPPLTVANPILRVALHVIYQQGRAAVSFDEVTDRTIALLHELGLEAALLAQPDAREHIRARLAGQLLRTFFADAVKYGVARPPIARELPERPATGKLQRYMAQTFDYSPNLWHEHVPIGEPSRRLLAAMDGTRTIDELQEFTSEPVRETLHALLKLGFVLEPSAAAQYL